MSSSAPPEASDSEAEFLAREMEAAKQAVLHTLTDLKADLATAADVRIWTRQHPWAAVGVAALTGFFAGAAVKSALGDSKPGEGPSVAESNGAPRADSGQAAQTPHIPVWISGLAWLMQPLAELVKAWALHSFQEMQSGPAQPAEPQGVATSPSPPENASTDRI